MFKKCYSYWGPGHYLFTLHMQLHSAMLVKSWNFFSDLSTEIKRKVYFFWSIVEKVNFLFKSVCRFIFKTTWQSNFKNNERIPGNLLKNLEEWKYHGILSVRKSGNPEQTSARFSGKNVAVE